MTISQIERNRSTKRKSYTQHTYIWYIPNSIMRTTYVGVKKENISICVIDSHSTKGKFPENHTTNFPSSKSKPP